MDPLNYFPDEIGLKILSYLPVQDLSQCCLVSKIWKEMATDDQLWNHSFPGLEVKKQKRLFYYANAVNSKGEILERIKNYLTHFPRHQVGTFTCKFPYNPHSSINLEISLDDSTEIKEGWKEVCVFTSKMDEGDLSSKTVSFYTENPGLKIFNLRIIPKKTYHCKCIVTLSSNEKIINLAFANQIIELLATRMNTLENRRKRKIEGVFFSVFFLAGFILNEAFK